MQRLIKQPAEQLKRQLPFAGNPAIVRVEALIAETRGLVDGSTALQVGQELVAGMFFVHLSGGTDGERYLVTGRGETAQGEILEAELEVAVIDGAWTMPDGGAPYLTIDDFVAKFGLEETVRMTDADGSGRIGRELLVSALSDVQAIVDAYLATLYQVPLAEVPAIVKVAIGDMARARLYPGGPPEGVDGAAKAGLRLLERISEGKLPLPVLAPLTAAPSSSPVLINAGRRQYPAGIPEY